MPDRSLNGLGYGPGLAPPGLRPQPATGRQSDAGHKPKSGRLGNHASQSIEQLGVPGYPGSTIPTPATGGSMKAWSFLLLFLCPGLVFAYDVPAKKNQLNTAPTVQDKIPATSKSAKLELLKVFRPALRGKESTDYYINPETQQLSITVYILNADLDRSTVIPGRSVKLKTPRSENAPGTIKWVNEREFIWTSDASIMDTVNFCDYTPDCFVTFTLTDEIRSKQGAKIDGDNDGKEGGNFVASIPLLG